MSSENIQKASNINSNQSANVKEIDHSNENLAGPSGLQKIREQETTPPGFKTALSPEMIRPLPKASNRTNRTQRKKRKSAILTDTPIKDEIEQEKMSRQNKKQAKSIKKNLSSTQKKTKGKKKEEILSDEEDCMCLVCGELYSASVESWIRCTTCKQWAHTNCTDGNAFYVCHNCDSDDDM
ncbi:hypothetical protein RN001_013415 [Aquatica leii]|uniref:Zinc finger PHD-type domain-containing protein n=1 Tax=Aquatica leii TaxID=1421715 RepID=A0AAN7PZV3_9COLE|nr:hypothetical protein RN001_013415 [Aquatica leii]